jgi:ribosome recycling factor
MQKAIEALHHNLMTVRTGRASTALVDNLMVEAYGSMMPLNQLAGISVPEARLIVIQPYDASMLRAIEKAIQQSDLALNPQNDGRIIRLNIPTLTEDRRREMVKLVRTRTEEIKVSIRNHRRDTLDELRKLENEKAITEDELRRAQDRVQELTDRFSKEADQVSASKEAEVMEI